VLTDDGTLSIRDVVARTGVSAATLRVWESRYGFPVPERLPSGHRRYTRADCDAIARVLAERARGVALHAAIERVRSMPADADPSLFAALRRARPQLAPQVLSKRALVAFSHAIEDEVCARADRPLLFGAFQQERFYRASEPRWRELARTAELAIAFADFERKRIRRRGVCELPLDLDAPLRREWALVCDGEELSVALTAWEVRAARPVADHDRSFELVWTVEPDAVRHVARQAAALAASVDPALVRERAGRLEERPVPPPDLDSVMALMRRCIGYLGAAQR
jgi:DICT domain-containing protein/predicted DNA-binding transcriptional regulator AlpA